MDISGLRRSYEQGELDEAGTGDAPLALFERWFADARGLGHIEANAMALATVDADNRPSVRTVLMKGFDADGIVFYTNYTSRKGRELDANPHAAVLFHWAQQERQVRIEGAVEKVSEAESDDYYDVRPLDSRIGAWASPQSEVIPNRAVLVTNAAKAAAEHGLRPPRPAWWGGYRLVPTEWEFWQGRKSRLHDRLRYRLVDGRWVRDRLAP
ncbi:MAG: pyridoxamine 5'-phosphate oxidase [Propionibacteriaceae bacterium]|nr:pyridoxamine 5'-phosphate oxidase [Propionibacteriaceae bacterium]